MPHRPTKHRFGPTPRALLAAVCATGLAFVLAHAAGAAPAARSDGRRGAPGPRLARSAGQTAPTAPAPPADVRTGNRLINPGFEGAFVLVGAAELVVGEGWTPWYDGSLVRPEFKDEPYVRYKPDGGVYSFSLRVFHGQALQKFFTSSAAHDAGLSQRVAVPSGARVRFSAFVMAWTSDCDDPCVSPLTRCPGSNNSNGEYRVQIGVDPTGAPPPALGQRPPDTVVWSPDAMTEAWDRWLRLGMDVDAASDAVTVYLRGRAKWAVKHNDSYWDEARLEVVPPTATAGATTTAATATATASPTAAMTSGTPVPSTRTSTPAATLTEAPTATATATRTSTPAPPAPTAIATATEPPTTAPTAPPTERPTAPPTEPPAATVYLPITFDHIGLPLLAALRASNVAAPRDAVPDGANIVIEYPIRSHPGMVNFSQPTCDELSFEQVLIRNAGTVTVRMAGWTLSNAAGAVYTFPPIRLDSGEYVRVWTGVGPAVGYDGAPGGSNDVTDGHFVDLYWRRKVPAWDNATDRATLKDDLGTVVAERGYP